MFNSYHFQALWHWEKMVASLLKRIWWITVVFLAEVLKKLQQANITILFSGYVRTCDMLLINLFVSFLEKIIAIKLLDVSPFRISMTNSTRQCKSLVCFSKLPSLIHIDIVLCFFSTKDAWIILCSSWMMVLSEPNCWIFCVLRFFEKEK